MTGRIHSTESFGTVDGPGIRYVVFMQGCPMRCLYCHNPDTWDVTGGREVTPAELMDEFKKNASFYSRGGMTVTGGEPLLQVDFLIELFKLAKRDDIHTCIDTSGITYNPRNQGYTAKLDELMTYTDLVMLDIKHIDPGAHNALTGRDNAPILEFARYLDKKGIPVWIRHVIVEGYTSDSEEHRRLGEFIGTLKNVKALDVLPYHTMGVNKYKELGVEYPLGDMPALDKAEAVKARATIIEAIRKSRSAAVHS